MKWLDDMKEAGAAFKEWGRWLTIIGALTVMIAESRPEEKEMMVNLVMTFLK